MTRETVSKGLYSDTVYVARNYWLLFVALWTLIVVDYFFYEFTEDLPDIVILIPRLVLYGFLNFVICAVAVNLYLSDKSVRGNCRGFVFRNIVLGLVFYVTFYVPMTFLFDGFSYLMENDIVSIVGYEVVIDCIFLLTVGIYLPVYLKEGVASPSESFKFGRQHISTILKLLFKGIVPLGLLTILVSFFLAVAGLVFDESTFVVLLREFRLIYGVFAFLDAFAVVMFYVIVTRLYWLSRGGKGLAEIFE